MQGPLDPIRHSVAMLFRGRLRCPRCEGRGTWNPHGGVLDRADLRGVRRWMCKWCGLYRGPEGWQEVLCDVTVGAWQLVKDATPGSATPKAFLAEHFGNVNPWRY